jgi:FkbM family methyltransferase
VCAAQKKLSMPLLKTLAFVANHPLNRGRKVRALADYFKWQIGSRLVPGQVIYNWINGSRIIVRRGETGVTGNLYCSLHDFGDMAYLLHVLSPDDLFVDIGANVGSYTILACAAKGAKGICFEPVPSTFERLMDNLRINNLSERVEAKNIGLSDREGELSFTSAEDTTNHIVARGETASNVVRVRVLPLDAVLSDGTPSLLKIDVEGFETPVLEGARRTLGKRGLHSVIMELNGSGRRYGFEDSQIIDYMSSFGFSTFRYEPFSRELIGVSRHDCSSGNTLFVRDAHEIQTRLSQAPQVLVGSVWL